MRICAAAARSKAIDQAATALAVSWIFSVLWWLTMSPTGMTWGFSVIDIFLAAYFFQLSKTRRFPRPLFALHVSAILFQAASALLSFENFWVWLVANRYFEASLIYVSGCALYRVHVRRAGRKRRAGASRPEIAIRRRLEAGA
jgi:hypothetical protein